MTTLLTNEQCADILDTYADLRSQFLTGKARLPGAFNEPDVSQADKNLIMEIASFRAAAELLLNLDTVPAGVMGFEDKWREQMSEIRPTVAA